MNATPNPATPSVATPPRFTVAVESISRTLRDAALYLSRHGWIQGAYYDTASETFTPAACMVGAVGMVCYGGPVDTPAQMYAHPEFESFDLAATFLDEYLSAKFSASDFDLHRFNWDAYGFNDVKHRTADQVVAALTAAADQADYPHCERCRPPDDNQHAFGYLIVDCGCQCHRNGDVT